MIEPQPVAEESKEVPKKRMKLVISDLHLGTGRVLQNGSVNQLEEFYFEEKLVEFLHYYTTGQYSEYEVELVINGDFLNFLQVDYRDHYLTVITESVSVEKLKNIIAGHPKAFEALRQFAASSGNSITYVVGNHDQSVMWPGVRAHLNEVLGCAIRYKNLVYFFDGVHIEHGHMHEAANRFDPRKFFLKKNLPEPILNLPFGSHFFIDFVMKIKQRYPHVDKIRPFDRMIRWMFLHRTLFALKTLVKLLWYFASSAFRRDPSKPWTVQKILRVMLESAVFPDLGGAARKILEDERVKMVIFGHTHVYQYRQWPKGEYFNTGTWTELTSLDISSLGMITRLTYVLIDYDDEGVAHGRLKEWRGYHRIEEDVNVS